MQKKENIPEEELNFQLKKTIQSLENLEFKNMLSEEEDSMSAIMTINPGAGGNRKSRLGRNDNENVFNVGEKNGYKVKELDFHKAEPAGIKSVTLEFEGEFAFGNLKGKWSS